MLNIGHRGAMGYEPENTLLSIQKAIELGADYVEIDIHLVDGQLVVIHDETLDRTTNFKGFLANYTFEELRKIKHKLPTGSVSKIADELNMPEQTVRNYFGAKKYSEGGKVVDLHVQPGPNGGIIEIDNPQIIELARQMISGENSSN